MNENIDMPHKAHLKVQEVCSLTNVRPYVLKYWESEFPEIAPITSSSGQKLYEHKDVEIIALIKNLLFEKDMTIEQAKAEVKLNALQLLEKVKSTRPKKGPMKTMALKIDLLMLARKKLNAVLILIQSLKERHHWD